MSCLWLIFIPLNISHTLVSVQQDYSVNILQVLSKILGDFKKLSYMKTSPLNCEFGVAPPRQIQTSLYHDIIQTVGVGAQWLV